VNDELEKFGRKLSWLKQGNSRAWRIYETLLQENPTNIPIKYPLEYNFEAL
jgi:hypothetical protein